VSFFNLFLYNKNKKPEACKGGDVFLNPGLGLIQGDCQLGMQEKTERAEGEKLNFLFGLNNNF